MTEASDAIAGLKPLRHWLFGTVLPAGGAGLKAVASALTKRGLSKVDAMTRSRSPLYQANQAVAPQNAVSLSLEHRAALIRALILGQMQQGQ